ncbi:MAG: hypothetical protein DRG82_02320 [Deltaproteobacteria bacterium]|nr:MAG: hypothetical protein DRG82_02320 [Deltaproteobacteria bacterium]
MVRNVPNTSLQPGEVVPPGIAGQVAEFAGFLKSRGYKVFQSSILDSLRSLQKIPVWNRMDFFHVLRVNFVSSDIEWAQFRDLFEEFFKVEKEEPREDEQSLPADRVCEREKGPLEQVQTEGGPEASIDAEEGEKGQLEGITYSPISRIEKKDLFHLDPRDLKVAQLALKKMMVPFHLTLSRRLKKSRKQGNMDFRRVMRKSLKGGGLPLELFFREKRKRLKRLVILADVSGSMDRYARFVMPFLLGLRGVGPRAEVFVFSTTLSRVTPFIQHLSIEKALERISEEVPDWSGGTRIGYSLHQFNQAHGSQLLNKRTVVVVMSDGWDLGGKELLRREMAAISRQAHSVIWLNPLAGDPDYRPVCQGMRIAFPYIDYFLPADSLESLNRVGKLLSKVMVH